jgi:hypothetical protein
MYAIKVCLNEQENEWIYITEDTKHCWDLKPLLFEDAETAMEYAQSWTRPGKEHNVIVVEYND